MTLGICVFKDVTRRAREAGWADFLLLGRELRRVRGDGVEGAGAPERSL